MTSLAVLDLLARGIAIGALFATAIGFARADARDVRIAGVLFCLSAAAYAINSSVPASDALGPLDVVSWLASFSGVGLFWLFVLTVFDDRRLTPVLWLPVAALFVMGLVAVTLPRGAAQGVWVVQNLLEISLGAHALMVIWRSWRGDLVERRRRLRGPFLAGVTALVIVLALVEIFESLSTDMTHLSPLLALTLALYCCMGALVFLTARSPLTGGPAPTQPASPLGRGDTTGDGLSGADRHLLAKLTHAMDEEDAWRQEGLTIGALAERLGAPEHRLRALINQRLGHRNFTAFLNSYRIAAATAALSDPARAADTVSALAFELGFASLGPFNRAFKDATGLTPTAWRDQALRATAPQDASQDAPDSGAD